MGNRDWNKESVLVFDQGRQVDSIRRIIFGELGGYGVPPRPDATGLANYRGAHATVHRAQDGTLFIDLSEPLVRGRRPLTANWN
jgi:hypothetical protein